jgi:2-desacetyl-2-hydroxyethyl bacteriochlorophyllide A dehydrogenase
MIANAVVFSKANTVEYKSVQCPEPGPDDAVIRVMHSWISNGTEGSFLRGERTAGDTAYRSGDRTPFPIVAGYQKIGVIEWVGENVKDLSCGETVFCVAGRVLHMFQPHGGHVSPSVTPRNLIWKLPSRPEALAFAGLVLTQVGYNCGMRAPIEAGEWAVVIGDGQVGQWSAQTLASRRANVIVIGRRKQRLEMARKLIGCHTIDAGESDWRPGVKKLAGATLAVGVDTVGSPEATESLVPLLRHFGHIVSAGFCGTNDRISLQSLRDSELSLDSVASLTPERMDATVAAIADGTLKTLPLITHRFPVGKAAEAWKLIENRDPSVMGVILDW